MFRVFGFKLYGLGLGIAGLGFRGVAFMAHGTVDVGFGRASRGRLRGPSMDAESTACSAYPRSAEVGIMSIE